MKQDRFAYLLFLACLAPWPFKNLGDLGVLAVKKNDL